MKPTLIALLPALLAAPLFAQKVDLAAKDADQPQHFSITNKFQTTDTRKMLINGEEPAAGGGGRGGFGGGGGGETSVSQQFDFVQAPGGKWREYGKLSATQSRPGRDGEAQETVIEGALQGKKVFVATAADGSVKLTEGEGKDAKEVDAALSAGVPANVSLAGFLPGKAVAKDEAFEIAGFADALRGLVHAVTPERTQGAGGGRGQGGQAGGQGGRGARGQGAGRAMGVRSTVIDLISAGKLEAQAEGKLLGVADQIASIEITAKLTGKGNSTDLGLQAGFGGGRAGRGGRGGQGGDQAADSGTDDTDAGFEIKGTVKFNVATQQVVSVVLTGDVKIDRATKRTMQGRDGEEMKMDSTTSTKGKFELQAVCEPAGK